MGDAGRRALRLFTFKFELPEYYLKAARGGGVSAAAFPRQQHHQTTAAIRLASASSTPAIQAYISGGGLVDLPW